jgi:TATA-box binding protein (TBP) (component of TFIID and TFIIIB)
MEEIVYRQTNHVILAQTFGRQPLVAMWDRLGYGKYRPKTYSALTQKFANPKTTAIIFSTGNITSMGCSTYYGALRVLLELKHSLGLQFINIKLSNIVINFSIKHLGELDLDAFYKMNQQYCTFNVEVFPCLTYNIPNTNIKCNIFATHKVVLAGCQDHTQIKESIKKIVARVEECIAHQSNVS